MKNNLLNWRLSDNGHVHVADSFVTNAGTGSDLTWYIGGGGNHWGVALCETEPGVGQVWHEHVVGPIEDAKAVAQKFEEENAGAAVEFPLVDVLERYYLVGGAFVTRRATSVPKPLHIGELNGNYTQPVAKELRKARRDNKVLRIITENGIAVIPATQITHVVVVQRWQRNGEEFVGEPGFPQHVYDHLAEEDAVANDLVEQIMGLADEYAAAQVQEAHGTAGPAEEKAAEAAREHLRTHVAELVNIDEEHVH